MTINFLAAFDFDRFRQRRTPPYLCGTAREHLAKDAQATAIGAFICDEDWLIAKPRSKERGKL